MTTPKHIRNKEADSVNGSTVALRQALAAQRTVWRAQLEGAQKSTIKKKERILRADFLKCVVIWTDPLAESVQTEVLSPEDKLTLAFWDQETAFRGRDANGLEAANEKILTTAAELPDPTMAEIF